MWCAGEDGFSDLRDVEVFDPATGTWAAAAPLATPRCNPAVVALGGLLYAIGGFDGGPSGPPKPRLIPEQRALFTRHRVTAGHAIHRCGKGMF